MIKDFLHVCEVCDKSEMLTSEAAYNAGWDYPPNMGVVGVISPRTCGECSIDGTAWFALVCEHVPLGDLSPKHLKTIARILDETETLAFLSK